MTASTAESPQDDWGLDYKTYGETKNAGLVQP